MQDASWQSWTATRTSWTDVGAAPVVTAVYLRKGHICFFRISVDPDTSTATTDGTSYTNLPLTPSGRGTASMVNTTTNVAVGLCVIDSANSRCYVPTLVASGNNFTISGWFSI